MYSSTDIQSIKERHIVTDLTRFKTSTFGLLLLKIVVKLTFFSNAIPVLNICLLQLFFYAFAYAFAVLLVVGEKKFSSSRGGKVDLISLLFYC